MIMANIESSSLLIYSILNTYLYLSERQREDPLDVEKLIHQSKILNYSLSVFRWLTFFV